MEETEKVPLINEIQNSFHSTADFKNRTFTIDEKALYLCYLETMVDSEVIQSHILKNLFLKKESNKIETSMLENFDVHSLEEGIQFIINGYIIVSDGLNIKAYSTTNKIERSVQESESESISLGAHDGFVESLTTNSTLIRKKLRSKELMVKTISIGKDYPVKLAIFYLRNLTPTKLIEETEKKIKELDSKLLIESVHLQQVLEDYPSSPFPQVMRTERPDLTVRHLLKGKPAILLDNEPNALLFPYNMYNFLQSSEDFNFRWLVGGFYYVLRMIAFWIAVILPAFYIAVIQYHSNILPLSIFYTLKISTENVPLPPLLEALTMQIILELLKEAAIRLPKSIGSTIGTVGAIVIGTAIVQTNLISNAMVVVISITALASFSLPSKEMSIISRIMGIPLLFLASLFGFIGISFGMLMILSHISEIKLMGYRYIENPGFTEINFLKKRKGKTHDYE